MACDENGTGRLLPVEEHADSALFATWKEFPGEDKQYRTRKSVSPVGLPKKLKSWTKKLKSQWMAVD